MRLVACDKAFHHSRFSSEPAKPQGSPPPTEDHQVNSSLLDLSALCESLADDHLVVEVLETFRQETRRCLRAIEQAWQFQLDWEVMLEVGNLQELARNVGAGDLAGVCVSLDTFRDQLRTPEMAGQVTRLAVCGHNTLREVEVRIRGMGGALSAGSQSPL